MTPAEPKIIIRLGMSPKDLKNMAYLKWSGEKAGRVMLDRAAHIASGPKTGIHENVRSTVLGLVTARPYYSGGFYSTEDGAREPAGKKSARYVASRRALDTELIRELFASQSTSPYDERLAPLAIRTVFERAHETQRQVVHHRNGSCFLASRPAECRTQSAAVHKLSAEPSTLRSRLGRGRAPTRHAVQNFACLGGEQGGLMQCCPRTGRERQTPQAVANRHRLRRR